MLNKMKQCPEQFPFIETLPVPVERILPAKPHTDLFLAFTFTRPIEDE